MIVLNCTDNKPHFSAQKKKPKNAPGSTPAASSMGGRGAEFIPRGLAIGAFLLGGTRPNPKGTTPAGVKLNDDVMVFAEQRKDVATLRAKTKKAIAQDPLFYPPAIIRGISGLVRTCLPQWKTVTVENHGSGGIKDAASVAMTFAKNDDPKTEEANLRDFASRVQMKSFDLCGRTVKRDKNKEHQFVMLEDDVAYTRRAEMEEAFRRQFTPTRTLPIHEFPMFQNALGKHLGILHPEDHMGFYRMSAALRNASGSIEQGDSFHIVTRATDRPIIWVSKGMLYSQKEANVKDLAGKLYQRLPAGSKIVLGTSEQITFENSKETASSLLLNAGFKPLAGHETFVDNHHTDRIASNLPEKIRTGQMPQCVLNRDHPLALEKV